jgi:hypothetical protein
MSITIVLADDHAVLRDSAGKRYVSQGLSDVAIEYYVSLHRDDAARSRLDSPAARARRGTQGGRCYRTFGLPCYRGRVIIEIGPCSSAG